MEDYDKKLQELAWRIFATRYEEGCSEYGSWNYAYRKAADIIKKQQRAT